MWLLLLSLAEAKTKKKEEPPPPPPPAPMVDPEAWRATQPGPAAEKAWQAPVPTEVKLSNGIPVWVVPEPGLPLVSVELVMGVGREANPKGKPGLSALTANLLDEGTTTRDAQTIARTLSSLGAELSVSGGDSSSSVTLQALSGDRLGPALDLMADVVLAPKFDKGAVSRVRSEVVDGITAEGSNARRLASRAFAAQLYGADHPYGTPASGTAAAVGAYTDKDLKSFYKLWWHAGNAAIVVTGDVTAEGIQAELEKRFGGWKVGKAVRPPVVAPSTPLRTRVVFVEMPGAVQTLLMVGTPGPSRGSGNFYASNFATTLFGGMFSSRLNMNLREEKGWSYGAYATLTESRDNGLLFARTQVQADKTAPALQEIFKEMQAAAAREPTADEMKLTSEYLLKSLPGAFETNAGTAGAFATARSLNLGPEAYRAFATETGKISPAQSAAQAKAYLDPARMIVVAAGPRTIAVDDGKGGKTTVDVVAELKALGYEYAEWKP